MSPHARRHSISAARTRCRGFVQPQCERLEERLALALFTAQMSLSFPGLNNNTCVAVSDLNKDGLADAVLSNFGTDAGSGAAPTITVLYGRLGGGFSSANLNTGGQNVTFVSIADINADSWPDVVASNANRQSTGSVSVFRNDAAGNLSLVGSPFSTFSDSPSWVGLADLTGDAVLDMVVGSSGGLGGNNVNIFRGNSDAQGKGDFTFSSSPITTLAPDPQFSGASLAVADFDGDGLKDIAAAAARLEGSVYVFRGIGSGAFAAPTQYGSGGALPVDIKAAHLNGDNRPDLVVANAGDPNANPAFRGAAVGVLLNVGSSGNLSFGAATSLTANTHGTFAVAVDDYNLDGRTDIASVNYGAINFPPPDAFVSVYMGNGAGTFTPGSPGTYDTRTDLGGGQYLAVGDFDANDTPDLIVAHASNRVGVLLNTTVPPAPSVLGSEFVYATAPQRLTFAFDQNVRASLGLDDITVERLGAGTITPAGVSFDTATKTATVNFSGILANGNYRATLSAPGITNSSGTPMAANYVLDFFVLAGDINRDRRVDGSDFAILASNFGRTGRTYEQGDLNGSGSVDGSDFAILAGNFGRTVPAPAAAATVAASARVRPARRAAPARRAVAAPAPRNLRRPGRIQPARPV